MQAELIGSGCFDVTLGSMELVCQHLFVEKTSSSGFKRGSSSSMSYSASDETTAWFWLFLCLSSAGLSGEASSQVPKSLLPREEPCVRSCPGMAA